MKTLLLAVLLLVPELSTAVVWQIGIGGSDCNTLVDTWNIGRQETFKDTNFSVLSSQAYYFVWEVYKSVVASQKRPTVFTTQFLQNFIYYGARLPRHRTRFFVSMNKDGKADGVLMVYDGRTINSQDNPIYDTSGGEFPMNSLPMERKIPWLKGKLNDNKIEFFQLATREGPDVDRLKVADELVYSAISYFALTKDGKVSADANTINVYAHADRPTSILYPRRYKISPMYGPKELNKEGEYVLGGNSVSELYDKLKETLDRRP